MWEPNYVTCLLKILSTRDKSQGYQPRDKVIRDIYHVTIKDAKHVMKHKDTNHVMNPQDANHVMNPENNTNHVMNPEDIINHVMNPKDDTNHVNGLSLQHRNINSSINID